MDLPDRVSQDVIKIFHNAKVSILHDVVKWTQDIHNMNHEALQINETEHPKLEGLQNTEDIEQHTSEYETFISS